MICLLGQIHIYSCYLYRELKFGNQKFSRFIDFKALVWNIGLLLRGFHQIRKSLLCLGLIICMSRLRLYWLDSLRGLYSFGR